MYTSVRFVPCNGQHITYQHADGWAVVSRVPEDLNYRKRMERKELTLSFHNLIKRGSVVYLFIITQGIGSDKFNVNSIKMVWFVRE